LPRVGGALSARSGQYRGTTAWVSNAEADTRGSRRGSLLSLPRPEWWAHFEFTRMNITPTILRKKIEDVRECYSSVGIDAGIINRILRTNE
jgi:hypothetical protein